MLYIEPKSSKYIGKVSLPLHGPDEPEPLYWPIASMLTTASNVEFVVNILNAYWATKSKADQKAIYRLHEKAHEIIELGGQDGSDGSLEINKLVIELMDKYHHYDDIKAFLTANPVKLPPELKQNYDIDAPEGPVTYLQHEYVDLLNLAIQCKAMLLIWGYYITGNRNELGTTHKELYGLKLLNGSHVTHTPPYKRLVTYVEARVGNIATVDATVLSGLSSSEYPEWFFGLVTLRRIASAELVELNSPEEPVNLIRKIYNFIEQKIGRLEKSFDGNGKIRDKADATANSSDENKPSVAENYRRKEKISEGDQMVNSVYLLNSPVSQHIDETVPVEYIEAARVLMDKNIGFDLNPIQSNLCRWIVSGPIGPRKFDMLELDAYRVAIIHTQALLMHWMDDINLALLLTAKPVPYPTSRLVGVHIDELSKQNVQELLDIYPYYQMGKTKPGQLRYSPYDIDITQDKLRQQNLEHNPVFAKLKKITSEWTKVSWKPQSGAMTELSKVTGKPYTLQKGEFGHLPPADLRNQLARVLSTIYNLKIQKEGK